LAFGQQTFTIKGEVDFIEVDNMENIYSTKGSELKLYNPKGEFLYRYSNKINGVISCLDATNPLRIIVFYKESNTVIFLNQQLSPISDPIDIYESANIDVLKVGISTGGSFWAFSSDRQSLILFSSKLEKTQESQNLRDWIDGKSIEFIREQNQKVYLGLSNKVLVFDTFGLYITTLHFDGVQNIKMVGDKISYIKGQSFWVYNPLLKNEVEYPMPANATFDNAFCNGKNSFLIFKDSITIYKSN